MFNKGINSQGMQITHAIQKEKQTKTHNSFEKLTEDLKRYFPKKTHR